MILEAAAKKINKSEVAGEQKDEWNLQEQALRRKRTREK